MKKILLLLIFTMMTFTLIGCDEEEPTPDPLDCEVTPEHEDCVVEGEIEVINLVGMDYSDALKWASDNKVSIIPSSEYRDDVEPNAVFYQDLEVGTRIDKWDQIHISYSRGYNPEGEIVIPDFSGLTVDEVRTWLQENDINKYYFYETFVPAIDLGNYVKYEVEKKDELRENYIRSDVFKFYFSRGELVPEVVVWEEGTVRGVNLGGWFVLESWMTPELFDGISDAHDETTWIINNPDAEADLIEHWDTFITEEDFQWLAEKGVEYVRLPIPWWMFGGLAYEDTQFSYEGELKDYEVTYIDSSFYIDRAMTWAETYGINVLVDLHTAPGGQNGFDNGGLAGINEWADPEYVTLTLNSIIEMMPFFNQYDSFWGFEVLNEPGWGVPLGTLQDYYVDAYNIIRAYNPDVWVGFHDGFRMYMENEWTAFFTDNTFTNVFFDIHLYQVFGDSWSDMDIFEHLDWVEIEQRKAVLRYEGIVPTVVGEWSGGLPVALYEGLDPEMAYVIKDAFLSAQLNVYEEGFGHFFWSYQILQATHSEWDFVRMLEQGLIPDDWSDIEGTE